MLRFLARRAIPGLEEVSQTEYRRPGYRITVHADGVTVHEGDPERVRALFDLDADPAAIDATLQRDPAMAPLVARRPGLRAPGAIDPPEILARAIVGQQISVAAARTILGRLPRDLAGADPGALPLPRSRAQALVGAMAAVADDPGILCDRARLLALPGVGPWTADYVALRLGDRDAFPAGDLVARRALTHLQADPLRWRPFRAYGLHHLWLSESSS